MAAPFTVIVAKNNTGQTITFDSGGRLNLKIVGYHDDIATGREISTVLSDDDFGFVATSTLADGIEIESSEIDNDTTTYNRIEVLAELTHDEGLAAVGTLDLFKSAGAVTGELPTDASGYGDAVAARLPFVTAVTWDPNGLDDELMPSPLVAI